jgi:FtsP/CotA-like multicopper oxidase with cupredoxin domain
MNRSKIKRLVAVALVAGATSTGALTSVAHAEPAGPSLPTDIAVEAGNKVFLVGHAVGVQIQTCTGTGGGYSWVTTPRADLYGDNGKLIATHFAGPTWRATDGSSVVGQRVNGVTVDPTAIPWLLLSARSPVAGSDGDRLAGTTFIQRTATTGGLPPAASLCQAGTLGTAVEVPYTADYTFWKSTGT